MQAHDDKTSSLSPRLTLLSFGGGQDSTAILYRLLRDSDFRRRYAPHDLAVTISDTGDEHPSTMDHIAEMRRRTVAAGVPFFHLTPDLGFHSPSWRSLTHFYRTHGTIGSKAFPKTCTDRLKIQPFYRWLEAYIANRYGIPGKRKSGLYRFTEIHGRVRVLIGIGAEEASRRVSSGTNDPVWMQRCIEKRYPLVEQGMSRADCIAYLRDIAVPVPMPSNCMRCHFASPIELLWLANEHPDKFHEWAQLESAKLAKHEGLGSKNFGVFGKRTLLEILGMAKLRYGHLSREEVQAYKSTHGHCTRSTY